MTTDVDMNALFGELRSHLEQADKHWIWAEFLLDLAARARHTDEMRFIEQWVPYLEDTAPSWPSPLFTVDSMEELARLHDLLPACTVRLMQDRQTLTPNMLRLLLVSPGMEQVVDLNLHHTNLGRPGMEALSSSTIPGQLDSLDLGATRIDLGCVHTLLRSQPMARLRFLNLEHNDLVSMPGLRAHEHIDTLHTLILRHCHMDDDSLRLLSQALVSTETHTLILDGNRVSDAGVASLVSSPDIANLRALHIGSNRITAAGVEAIASSPHLSGLTTLALGETSYSKSESNEVGERGAMALAHSPYLSNLEEFVVSSSQLNRHEARIIESSRLLSERARQRWIADFRLE